MASRCSDTTSAVASPKNIVASKRLRRNVSRSQSAKAAGSVFGAGQVSFSVQ